MSDEQTYSLQLLEKIKTRTLEIPLNDHLQNVFYSVQLDLWVNLNLAYISDISNTIHFSKFRTNKTDKQVLLRKPYHIFPPQDEHHYSAHHCLKTDILLDANYRAFENQTNSPWVAVLSSPPAAIFRQASLCCVLLRCLHVSHKWDWAFPVSNLLSVLPPWLT